MIEDNARLSVKRRLSERCSTDGIFSGAMGQPRPQEVRAHGKEAGEQPTFDCTSILRISISSMDGKDHQKFVSSHVTRDE